MLVFSSPNERFIIKGNVKINKNDSVPSFVTGNISHMLYNYAVKYLDDGSLKEMIDFDGFFYIGAQRNVSNISAPFRYTHKLNFGKDCLSVICLNNNLNSVIFSLSSESVPEYTVIKKHLSSMKMSKPTFINIVNTVIRQFGAIISKKYEYLNRNRGHFCLGEMIVILLSKHFIIPFVKMIKEILGSGLIRLDIPHQFIDNIPLYDNKIKSDLKKWFRENNIAMYEDSGAWYGTENNIQIAMRKLKMNPPNLSY